MHTFNTNAFLRRKLQIENTLNHYLAIYIAERNSRKGQGIQEGNRTNQSVNDKFSFPIQLNSSLKIKFK